MSIRLSIIGGARCVLSLAVAIGALSASQALAGATYNFDVGPQGFTVNNPNGALDGPWTYGATSGAGGSGGWSVEGQNVENAHPNTSDLTSPTLFVGAAGMVTFTFDHRYSFEDTTTAWDGGAVFISVNGGTFTQVPGGAFTSNGYNGTVLATSLSVLSNSPAFTNQSPGYGAGTFINSAGSVGPFNAGDTIQLRFRFAGDSNTSGGSPDWVIDNLDFGNAAAAFTCCDPISGACEITTGVCRVGAPLANPVACSPNPCPQPTACCNLLTGACVVALPGASCPAVSVAATPATSSCVPYPCAAVLAAGGVACDDCTYVNGPFDFRTGQLSHLGGASPHGSKAADDFYLCENFVYDVKTFSATLLTTTFPGLVKPKAEIWSDCGGCPGTLLYTFDNPLIIETGTDIGPAFDGRPLRVVHVTFDVNRETILANRNIVLKGGRYWLSVFGQSDNLGPSMQMFDVTYWGTTGGSVGPAPITPVVKGKAAYKIDGDSGNAYNVYTFPNLCGPTGWHSVTDDCCIGCTDLNFSFCTTPCKVLVDNGGPRMQAGGALVGSTSQFAPASWSAAETRSADDFIVPPCQRYHICYVEACILTNCPTFEGVFELYGNNCNKPNYALHGAPLFNTQFVATKIIPLTPPCVAMMGGTTVYGYRLEFHDLNITLDGGAQYWISAGVRYTFSINERAYFCYNAYCDGRCPIKWNDGRVLTATTLDTEAQALGCVSPAPIVGCNGWAKTGNDFSFLIAADGQTTPGPINSTPTCTADFNRDGSLSTEDVFDYLNAWFTGCP